MGLRPRLLLQLGLLIAVFSFFSAIVLMNAVSTGVRYRAERAAAESIEQLLQRERPAAVASAEIPAVIAFESTSTGSLPQAAEHEKQVVFRWYGPVALSSSIEGETAGVRWRAVVDQRPSLPLVEQIGRLLLAYLFLNAVALLVVAWFWLSRVVVRPVSALAQSMSAVRDAATFHPLSVGRSDEIGELTVTYNRLMTRVREAEAETRRQLEETREAYQRLEEAQERLLSAEKLAAIGRLSAGIAHEIGNPLSAILGYTQLLPKDDPEAAEAVERVRAEAQRIDRTIRGLLSLARVRRDDESPVAIMPLIAETVTSLRAQAAFKAISITTDYTLSPDETVLGGGRLEQVVVNLLLNASDAMKGRGAIEVSLRGEGRRALLTVSDTGAGIAADDLPHIFEPFYTTKPAGRGTGLGLAVTREIIEALGGTIEVSSRVGEGTTFVVTLPLTG